MHKGGCLFKGLLALVAVSLLVAAGAGILNMGRWQGYWMARATAGEQAGEADPRPHLPYAPGGITHRPYHRVLPFLCGVGLMLKLGLLAIVVMLVGAFLRHSAGRAACAAGVLGAKHWHRHPHWGHWHGKQWFEGKVQGDAEPEADTGKAEES